MVHHLVHRHWGRRFVPEDDHAQRIADENRVNSCGVQKFGHRVVVGGEHRDLLAAMLPLLQIADGHPLRHIISLRAPIKKTHGALAQGSRFEAEGDVGPTALSLQPRANLISLGSLSHDG
jgi:hypothetical protein